MWTATGFYKWDWHKLFTLRTRFDWHSTEIICPTKKNIKAKKAENLLDLAQKQYPIIIQTLKINILEKIEKNLSQNLLYTSLL